jgi:large repetitive protein
MQRLLLLKLLLVSAMLAPGIVRAQLIFPDFAKTDGLINIGNAGVSGKIFRLTAAGRGQAGGFWAVEKVQVARGFTTRFRFRISDTLGDPDVGGERGGDGLAFVIQTVGSQAIGGTGGRIGYHGIDRYVAIELDTYLNNTPGPQNILDPNANHISIQPNDNRHITSLGSITPPITLSDSREHDLLIEYRPGVMRIFLDGCDRPIMTALVKLEDFLPLDAGRAFVGFTSSTGTSWENHDILSWYFNPTSFDTTITVPLCEGRSALLEGPKIAARFN